MPPDASVPFDPGVPSDPNVTGLRQAETLVRLHRHTEALAILYRVIASDPGSARPRCLLAQTFLAMDDPARALEAAEGAAACDPTDEWAHRLRALALLRAGKPFKALPAAQASVRLAPEVVEPYLVLVDAQLAVTNVRAAQEAALRARDLEPERSSGHNALGVVALRRKRFRTAEEHFRDALRCDPQSPTALNNLGLALLKQGRRREAVHYFADSSRVNPHDSVPRRNAVRAALPKVSIGVAALAVTVPRLAVLADDWTAGLQIVVGAVLATALGAAALHEHRRRRSHEDPKAPKELMRQLRQSRRGHASFSFRRLEGSLRRPEGDVRGPVKTPVLAVVIALGALFAVASLAALVDPQPGETAAGTAFNWIALFVSLGAGAAAARAVIRRHRAS